ncbi:hypothetical protein TWF694_000240 [Orbilia ellipsospora]|uniref:Uncharacterized protein n=1 Tax=Orbilia ellipsospora TaxID=2528407 RepID=A0AAV9XQK6_9PEZI
MAKRTETTRKLKKYNSTKNSQPIEDSDESVSQYQDDSQTSTATTSSPRTKDSKGPRVCKNNPTSQRKLKPRKSFALRIERPDEIPPQPYYSNETICNFLDISIEDLNHITKILDGILEENRDLCEVDYMRATDEAKQQWADLMTAGLRISLERDVLRRLNERDHARVGFLLLKRALIRKASGRKSRFGKGKVSRHDIDASFESNSAVGSSPLPPARVQTIAMLQESLTSSEDEDSPPVQAEPGTPSATKKGKNRSSRKIPPAIPVVDVAKPQSPILVIPKVHEEIPKGEIIGEPVAKLRRRKPAGRRETVEKIHRFYNMLCLFIIVLSLWGIIFMLFLVVKGQEYAQEQVDSLYHGIRNRSLGFLQLGA